jgi:hypothetical protein
VGVGEGWFQFAVIPQALAFVYYQVSWLLYVSHPQWSYRLNADFEDHAEHEYALLVTEHPEWEHEQFQSAFVANYGPVDTVATCFARSATTSASTMRRASPE